MVTSRLATKRKLGFPSTRRIRAASTKLGETSRITSSSRHDFPSFQKDFRSWIRFLRFPILEGKDLLLFSRKNGTGIVTRLFRGCSEDRDDNVTGIIRNRKMDRKGRRFSIRK